MLKVHAVTDVKMYEVGGCVRDDLLDIASNDIDYAVEAESFDAMRDWLLEWGFTIFVETPEHFTIRAHFPKAPDVPFSDRRNTSHLTADFVLCRQEGPYSDGRRPDWVKPGTIYDDLARRDFTVNAMARTEDSGLLDPHGGRADLVTGMLRCVGNPQARMQEDSLRALRAVRFAVTKGMWWHPSLTAALRDSELHEMLSSVSTERKREELRKAFRHDTLETLRILHTLPYGFRAAVFTDGLWLDPSMKGGRG